MYSRVALLFLGLATIASAVPTPLNINLGAYSPAVVVGDGEISFAAAAEPAAAAGAAGAAEAVAVPAPAVEAVAPVVATPVAEATPVEAQSFTAANTLQGMGKQRLANLRN